MKNIKEIKTLEEMQNWVFWNIPIVTKTTRPSKKEFTSSFKSHNAMVHVIEYLAKNILNDLQNENTPL